MERDNRSHHIRNFIQIGILQSYQLMIEISSINDSLLVLEFTFNPFYVFATVIAFVVFGIFEY